MTSIELPRPSIKGFQQYVHGVRRAGTAMNYLVVPGRGRGGFGLAIGLLTVAPGDADPKSTPIVK
jgi:hypothetical protein